MLRDYAAQCVRFQVDRAQFEGNFAVMSSMLSDYI